MESNLEVTDHDQYEAKALLITSKVPQPTWIGWVGEPDKGFTGQGLFNMFFNWNCLQSNMEVFEENPSAFQ